MSKPYVLILGINFENLGAELMLHAAAAAVRETLGGIPVVEIQHGSPDKRRQVGVETLLSVQKARLHPWVPVLRRVSSWTPVLLPHDISFVLDASGFAFGDQWADAPLMRRARHLAWWGERGVPVILLPQAFGPFEQTRAEATVALSAATRVFARDSESLAHAESLHTSTKLSLAPDFTGSLGVALPHSSGHADETLDYAGAIVPNRQILSRLAGTGPKEYLDRLVTYGRVLSRRGSVAVLNHEGPGDLAIVRRLVADIPGAEVYEAPTAMGAKAVLGRCEIVVAGRFHAAVSALSQGRPCIMHGWSHKYAHLAADYDASELLEAPDSGHSVEQMVELALQSAVAARVREAATRVSAKTEEMWSLVGSDFSLSPGNRVESDYLQRPW